MTTKTETYSNDGPTCPHCGHSQTPDEGFYFDEDGDSDWECGHCEKHYRWTYGRIDIWRGYPLPK